MAGTWAVYKRELRTYFQSPSTYIVIALLFLVLGVIFGTMMAEFSELSRYSQQPSAWGMPDEAPNATHFLVRNTFFIMFSLILFSVPLLSMRLVAEEKNRGTFELLVTCPISDWAVLMGKYLALVSVGVAMILLSGIYPLMVWWFGRPFGTAPEWPIVASLWIGLLLIFAAYAAFGLMASAMTENQMAAGVITLIGLLLWNMMGDFGGGLQEQFPWLVEVLREASASQHTENFIKGVLTLKDFAFYILASFFFLFVASKTLDARRWRV